MASRALHGRPVDLGAAYFTVSDPEFAELVGRWRTAGLARPWTAEPRRARERQPRSGAGAGALGRPGRAAQPGRRTCRRASTWSAERTVRHVGPGPAVDGEHADAVVLAMPDPQAARLLHPSSPAAGRWPTAAGGRRIAVAAGWPNRQWDPLPGAFVNGHPVLALVADDGDRRGDGAPVLVAHTTAEVAREHDAEPDAAVRRGARRAARSARRRRTRRWTHAHRWRFAAPGDSRDGAVPPGRRRHRAGRRRLGPLPGRDGLAVRHRAGPERWSRGRSGV